MPILNKNISKKEMFCSIQLLLCSTKFGFLLIFQFDNVDDTLPMSRRISQIITFKI